MFVLNLVCLLQKSIPDQDKYTSQPIVLENALLFYINVYIYGLFG